MASIDDITQDLAELNHLHSLATRSNVMLILTTEIKKCEERLTQLSAQKSAEDTPKSVAILPLNKIITYAHDQSDKFVKLYVTIPAVETVGSHQVVCDFKPKSVDLFVRDVQGKNHQLTVQGLLHPIDPASSMFKIKKDTVLLLLKKTREGQSWPCVTEQEYKTKDKKGFDDKKKEKEEDPNASLMKLMKQMYDEGDDEMKRTIKKAWCEAQDKKGGGGSMMDNL